MTTSFITRAKLAARLLTRGDLPEDVPSGILPPERREAFDPLTLSTVFRGVQILQTAMVGLPINEYSAGVNRGKVSPIISRPNAACSRRDFISDFVACLALDGNAFVRLTWDETGIINCELLDPSKVTVTDASRDPASPDLRFSYLGKEYDSHDIQHAKFLNVPGQLRGYGPINAARKEVESAQKARSFKDAFYNDSSNLKGYLSTDQRVTPEYAQQAKADWMAEGPSGGIKVLGQNLKYTPLGFKPADLQFLETQRFDTTQISRLLGVPASLMLAAVEGSNLTYANIEQSWIEFADYTLAAYAGELEELFDRLLPRGRTARFDWDSSRRTNTSDRYDALSKALSAGWMTIDEVRASEGLPPMKGDISD
jgi:HK97 family phage portal protein